MARAAFHSAPAGEGMVVTKAVANAAVRLQIPNKVLARIVGLSEATVSRMVNGRYLLTPSDKPFELGLLFVRLFRSLDAIVDGDETVARAWLRNENKVLGASPLQRIQTVSGLVDVIAYLDARRALL
ncbi:antitoxin Xre/MbcA/ParS toxin-binding domain-containing protein [Microbaculum marinum]|uniref:Antitoxin Xre/MbcA/ParS toxin-binding domain-containing protein n=1 Tax=Microbaculum marinum TaxID=1764581 RepID=A0AAW9S261_9HYPH